MKKWIAALLFMWTGLILPATIAEGHIRFLVQDQDVTWEEMKIEDIPEAVDKSFKEYFADYTVKKVYISNKGSYKLEVSREEIRYILFYNEKGELIKVVQPEDAKQ
ncbi:MAG: hypothetical protein AB2L20_24060 [Mangrovibacterium sp.]